MTTFYPQEFSLFSPITNKSNHNFDQRKYQPSLNIGIPMHFKGESKQKNDPFDNIGFEWIVNILDSDDDSWSNDKSVEFSSSSSSSYSESTIMYPSDDTCMQDFQNFNESQFVEPSHHDFKAVQSNGYPNNCNNIVDNNRKQKADNYSNTNQWRLNRNQQYQSYSQYQNPQQYYPMPSQLYQQQYYSAPLQNQNVYHYQNLQQDYYSQPVQYVNSNHNTSSDNHFNDQFTSNIQPQQYVQTIPHSQDFMQNDSFQHSNSISIPLHTSKRQHQNNGLSQRQKNTNSKPVKSNLKDKPVIENDKKELESILKGMHEIMDRQGYDACKEHVFKVSGTLSNKFYSKICLEMVEFAKRSNNRRDAYLFVKATSVLDPSEPKAWLEYSKMEEEQGHLDRSESILEYGISCCGFVETLVLRMIRILHSRGKEEKVKSFLTSAILSSQYESKDNREWKLILEGAMLEWKSDRKELAIAIVEYLQDLLPTRTQTYVSGLDLYKKNCQFEKAYRTILRGIDKVPNAGALWFEALNVQQLILNNTQLKHTNDEIDMMPLRYSDYLNNYLPIFREKALENLSPELVWKFHLEIASISQNDLPKIRSSLYHSAITSPSNLLWKVWNKGALIELFYGSESNARKLMVQSVHDAPAKMRTTVLLDMAKLEEMTSSSDKAKYILRKAMKENQKEWKVHLESILIEMRQKNFDNAIQEAKEALKIHQSTGRLWAVLIQAHYLKYYYDIDCNKINSEGLSICLKVFKKALSHVPKSGEVWCEGARLAMHIGKYQLCKKFLEFALEFTPQYGDSIIEYLRLHILENEPQESENRLKSLALISSPSYGQLWSYCKKDPMEVSSQTIKNAKEIINELNGSKDLLHQIIVKVDMSKLTKEEKRRIIFGW